MTDSVAAQTPVTEHVGNGVTTSFAYTFQLLDSADLVVELDGGVQTSGYTVSGVGVLAGGSVLFTSAPASDVSVLLRRSTDLSRSTSYTYAGDLRETVVDEDFNRLWHAMQERAEVEGRALLAPVGETVSALPPASQRADTQLLFDSAGEPYCGAPVSGSAADVMLQYASTDAGKGAALVGFDPSTLYAALTAGWALRTASTTTNVLAGIDPALWAGIAAGSYTSALDTQIQSKIDALATVGGGVLFFPPGTYYFSTITPKSNVTMRGIRHASKLIQIQGVGAGYTGIYKASGGGSLANFHITSLHLDGGRVASPGNPFNHIINIAVGSGETLKNFSVTNCDFYDAQEDAIRITANHTSAQAEQIRVIGNTAITTPAKRSLGGTSFATAHDLVRIEQVYDYATSGNGYGSIHFRHIVVAHNQCESIRTCGDFKRGCSYFVCCGNTTKNMYDCHHSTDGSFYGAIFGNVCEQESTYTGPTTNTNFIECQGEHIVISGNVGNGNGVTIRGIFAHDYGRVEETPNKGHLSVNVHIRDNVLHNLASNGIDLINGNQCSVTGNKIFTATNYGVVLSSGGSRKASDGVTDLVGKACYVAGNLVAATGLGVRLTVPASVLGGANLDENGEEHIYTPSGTTALISAATFAPWRREFAPAELNPNTLLKFTGAGATNVDYFESTYPAATASATRPDGVAGATVLSDADAASVVSARLMAYIPATQNQRIYGRLWALAGTATGHSVLVQEFNGAAFLTSFFYGLASPGSWTEEVFSHKVAGAACTNLRVSLIPGASFNNAAATGTTQFADFRLSRQAIGVR